MNDIIWLTMRRLRTPLILLILMYFLSVMAMVLMPAVDPAGNPVRVSFLEAAYFVAIMLTTIGFGEMPYPFTDAQRLMVFMLVFPNVIIWLYAIGTILSLFLDPQFKAVLARARFTRSVGWLGGPYFIMCGFGSTGSMVVRGLQTRGLGSVVLESDQNRVHRMILEDDFAHVPALSCDSTDRRNLERAGLHRENCRGVIATTNDDHANLTIAITSKLLEPRLTVFARSENDHTSANMISFGTDYVINPYAIFAERLFLAFNSPVKYLVQDWLISVPGARLRTLLTPPAGHWILCGAGRFGAYLAQALEKSGNPFTVVEVHEDRLGKYERTVHGRGTEEHTLVEAGIHDAAGIIAATGDDVDNLSIVMTALALNSDVFVVARQERQRNDELFDACGADLVAKRGLIMARRIIALATTPLLKTFLDHLIHKDDAFAERIRERLEKVLYGRAPQLWVANLSGDLARGVRIAARENVELTLSHLTHNIRSEEAEGLSCVCLLLERGAQRLFLPDDAQVLQEGDRMLFAGLRRAQLEMVRALTDPNLLMNFATGKPYPRGAVWRRFS